MSHFIFLRLRLVVALTGACVLVWFSASALAAQSLGEVAKKEEARRKGVQDAAKVYTNRDLRGAQAPPPPPEASQPDSGAADAGTVAAPAAETPDPAEQEPVRDQTYWSGRIEELRTQLERDETYVEALQSRINSLSADFVNRDDPAQRAVIERDRQRAIAELDRLKLQVENGTKAIANLEEEARRAGVPPGWLR